MKKYVYKSSLIVSLTLFLIVFQVFLSSPWWLFLIPTFLFGVLLPVKIWKRSAFLIGFFAGFFAWIIPFVYFQNMYEGAITEKLAALLGAPVLVIILVTGILSGLITALALISGVQLRTGKEKVELQLDDENMTK